MLANRVAAFLVLCILAHALPATGAETSLTMTSDPGDYVGRGQTYAFDPSSAVFTPKLLNDGNGVEMGVNAGNFTNWWFLHFGAIPGQLLVPGTYVGATRYLGFGDTPGIDVYGNGAGCNQTTGAFQVKQLTIENGVLTKLWVRFEQHCEGAAPALTGDLRFNADVLVVVNAPFAKKVAVGQALTFGVTATAPGANPVTLTAEDLPPGATFDGTTFTWAPTDEQVGRHLVTFVGIAANGQDESVTVLDVAERPLTGDTSLRMVSDQGDYIGQGQTWNYGAGDGTFTGYAQSANVAQVSFRNSQADWDLEFAAPQGAPLTPGFYFNAKRYPFNGESPGLDVSGNGRGCNMLSGDFEVKQLVVSGATVTRFWARFEQHCEQGPPGLAGEIRLNADVTVAVTAPFRARLPVGQAAVLTVSGSAAAGGHVTLSAQNLPAGAHFEDLGDNSGRLTWTPQAAQRGAYSVVFVGEDGLGHQDRSTTVIEAVGATSLAIDSEYGEPLADGIDAYYGPDAGTFRVMSNFYDHSVDFSFIKPDYSVNWRIGLGAAGNAPLAPGNYEGAVHYAPANDRPHMSLSGNYSSCTEISGRFVVRQVEYGPDQTMNAFWATFEGRCEAFTTPLRGELRYNANVITDVTAPAADTLGPGQPLEFTVTATNAIGRNVILTANGMPEGASFVDHGDNTGTFAWTPTFAQIGESRVTFVGDDGAGGVDSATTRIVVPGETSLRLDSGPDGPGVLTPADGTFTGLRSSENRVRLRFTEPDRFSGWELEFGAPGNGVLGPGFFPGASIQQLIGIYAPAPTYPVLRVEPNAHVIYCHPTYGLFQVKQAEYGEGGAIKSFWATFEEDCPGGTPVIGEIRFNARVEVAVHAPMRREVAPGQPLEIFVRADDRLARHVALSATGLPDGANFVDRGDNTGMLTWTPGFDAIGLHDVTFVGDNGAGGQDRASTHIRVAGQVRLVIDADYGDPVGGQRSGVFTPANGPFQVTKNYKEGVSLKFTDKSSSYLGDWYVSMAAAHDAPLAPGVYQPVAYFPYKPDDLAGLAVTHGYDPCSAIDGRFEIQEIEYGPGIEITSLRATFEQHCSGSPAAVRGELRWHYDAPVLITAPLVVDTSDSAPLRFDVSAQVRAGGIAELTASNLPAGASFVDHRDNTGTLEWTPAETQLGEFVVTFRARTATGDEDSTRTRIRVRHLNRPPVARIAFTSPVAPGIPVTFDGSASFDPEGGALSHYWFFSDDYSNAYEAIVTHTFRNAGTFQVVHQVIDGSYATAYAETLVHVQATLSARVFVEGGSAVVRPASGKPSVCVRIEPAEDKWEHSSAVLSSIRMLSAGTGTVGSIPVLADKTTIDRDTDRNGIIEIEACFAKGDLEQLFSNVSGRSTVAVTVEGDLESGEDFRGSLDLPVSRPGRVLAATAVPTTGLHGYRLTFETSQPGRIQVRLFDVSGRTVRTLADLDQAQAGTHDFMIDRSDLPSGVYFYRIVTPEGAVDGKLVLLQ